MKSPTILLIIGALEVINEGEFEYLQKLLGSSVIGQMQKITLLGTVHIFMKSVFHYIPSVHGIPVPGSNLYRNETNKPYYNNNNNNNDNNNNNKNNRVKGGY